MSQHDHDHDHDHKHDHSHKSDAKSAHSHDGFGAGGHNHAAHIQSFNKAFAIAVFITFTYTFAEAGYGLYAHSMSLLADAAHNLGDGLGLILAWLANWLLAFPAKKRYSYGFKRTTIMASLINACILVATSALIAYESIYKLLHLTAVDEKIVIIVGLIGIVVNAGCSILFMRGAEHDLNIRSAFWHLMADAIILLGVVIAAVIINYTGWVWVDPVVGLIIVAIVVWGTWGLLRDSMHLMMDAIPRYIDHNGVKKYLDNIPGVTAVHDLHIWGLSTREVALTAHLVMPEKILSDADYKNMNDHLLSEFKINHVTIQVEKGSLDDPCLRSEMC